MTDEKLEEVSSLIEEKIKERYPEFDSEYDETYTHPWNLDSEYELNDDTDIEQYIDRYIEDYWEEFEEYFPSRDSDTYKDYLEEYGSEYLMENNYSDYAFHPMSYIDEDLAEYSPTKIALCIRFGTDYGTKEGFDINADYYAFNGYGNLLSIHSKRQLVEYLNDVIDYSDFMPWIRRYKL